MTLLQETTEAVVKAVPEIRSESWTKPHEGVALFEQFNAETGTLDRPITLEDVLRALKGKHIATIPDDNGLEADICMMTMDQVFWTESCCWLLGKPLSSQSEETIAFLHSLLFPTVP